MPSLREMFRRNPAPKTEVSAQPIDLDISPVIDPATGEKKAELERDCNEYLQSPDKATVTDFLKFTENMIALIGGKREKRESGNTVVTLSNPLLDKDADTSIVLKIIETEAFMTRIEIRARSPSKVEGLQVFSIPLTELPHPYSMYADFHQRRPEFDSYITGKREPEKPISSGSTDLEPNEAKGFAQRVFAVYQNNLA